MEPRYLNTGAVGFGLATVSSNNTVLDTWYPFASLRADAAASATSALTGPQIGDSLGKWAALAGQRDERRRVRTVAVRTTIGSLATPPADIHDVYLRLHLISRRLIAPRQANLTGFLDLMSDVAWTTLGPCAPGQALDMLRTCRAEGVPCEVRGTFKVPRMVDYVMPEDVWIADADRVLLGAHLTCGTTVTAEGFIGVNAGTTGPCMVEGRISLGALVGELSDVGGGASIMGTTSGGGKHQVTIGKRCLLGANAGVGISLGDDCAVEAGLYLTAGTRIRLASGEVVKAIDLSGRSGLVYRRNSQTGQIEALESARSWVSLHPSLHRPSPQPCLVTSDIESLR
ncbi:2,3,4,5-tetrahydropyridine-2,6-dicarboxylate N-succinyltransferase [Paraburkholderia guartelaensis]|uniref:2,3,4,5-tetrahydropyridine-2,6-dicarboxylate N-succinyltransferase n=1 Tax=Paraburkholderia guartelaensis TaxID=2546446 RepID=A0A4R5L799_9BURK|nr:DapH/DapD/GlmU-related protein [Paraburkholderia guartelaensis]TDG03826.1 2,3,4,5-tetrahydropyridine-2,6-dicarboxylate N-succinyltransferase [Paraburkholderia guartelaensis]